MSACGGYYTVFDGEPQGREVFIMSSEDIEGQPKGVAKSSHGAAGAHDVPDKLADCFPTSHCSLAPEEALDEASIERARAFTGRGFGHLALKGVNNARDLGGMPAADGRVIASGRLLRSGLLHDATASDFARFREIPLVAVVDLRTETEVEHQGDPVAELKPASWEHLSVLSSSALGITADEELSTLLPKFEEYREEPMGPSQEFYPSMLLSKTSIAIWRRFFDILLDAEHGAILWHCTAGKDRTGIAAFLVETALGVPQDLIMEDYLASNLHTEPLFEEHLRTHGFEKLAPKTIEMIHVLYTVNATYLQVAVAAVLARHGSVDAYFEEALGLGAEKIARLRELYLEEA